MCSSKANLSHAMSNMASRQQSGSGIKTNSRGNPIVSSHNQHQSLDEQHRRHHHHQRSQPKPFYLFSTAGQSIKEAILTAKKTPGLAKTKVGVVSIICKDKLNGTIRNELVQSLLGNNYKHQTRLHDDEEHAEDVGLSSEKKSLPHATSDLDISIYETQVTGNIDCDSNVVVLSLNSMLEADKLCQIVKPPEVITNFLFSPDWPLRSQNLIKTLHIMLSVSHVIIFYNPDLSLDHNLVQTLKILEVLRFKSQTRITDLLGTIEFRKYLPEKWVKQGRLCTPRSLFVFGDVNCGVNLKQSDITKTKRDLEDLIYMTLRKTSLISPTNHQDNPSLISLPDRDEFVFILKSKHIQKTHSINGEDLIECHAEGPKNSLDSFYHGLMNTLGYGDTVTTTKSYQNLDARRQNRSSCRRKNTSDTSIDEGPELAAANSIGRFKKFVHKHVSDMRSNSDQLGRQSNVVLPTYENLLAVLANLVDLFFPVVEDELGLPSSLQCWRKPDERRFVDIYNLLNHEEAFSKLYCYQVRETAFTMFSDRLISMPARNQADFGKLLQLIMQYYLTHARGSASLTFRDLLEQDCTNHWQDTRGKKSNRSSRNKLFSVARRADEIILTSSCDCGQKCSFKLTSKDKRTLDSVYITRLNRAESS